MSDQIDSSLRDVNNVMAQEENTEWELHEFISSVASDLDIAEDDLSLKSFARDVAFNVSKLVMEISVAVRRTDDGRLLYRTLAPGETSGTRLSLDFSSIFESQLEGRRKPYDQPIDARPLDVLPEITMEEINALNRLGIFIVEDILRYTRTAAMVAELSRRTGLDETKIRWWVELPLISSLIPIEGPPGSQVTINGRNFGEQQGESVVIFLGQEATIHSWSDVRIVATLPVLPYSGSVMVVVGGFPTNTVPFKTLIADLDVLDVTINPDPTGGNSFTFHAELKNQGTAESGEFHCRWSVDQEEIQVSLHNSLAPGEYSRDPGITHAWVFPPGKYTLIFEADINNVVKEVSKGNNRFERTFEV